LKKKRFSFETAFATWTGSTDADYEVYVRGKNILDWRDDSLIEDFLTDWTLVNDEENELLVREVDKAALGACIFPGCLKGNMKFRF
jgi:hypothetical protein